MSSSRPIGQGDRSEFCLPLAGQDAPVSRGFQAAVLAQHAKLVARFFASGELQELAKVLDRLGPIRQLVSA